MFKNTIMYILMALLYAVLSACGNTENTASQNSDKAVVEGDLNQTIYYGGDIVTMDGDKPEYVEAVV